MKAIVRKTKMEPIFMGYGIEAPESEFRFAPPRRWRFDFAWPAVKVAFEYEGGTWSRGGHVRGQVYSANCEKYNEAQILGWVVIRGTSDTVRSGTCLVQLQRAIESRRPNWRANPNDLGRARIVDSGRGVSTVE